MNRKEFKSFIAETYGIEPDNPFSDSPDCEVYRHPGNRKWFALVMSVPKRRLGLQGDDTINVVNLKCDPFLMLSLYEEKGFLPAYHMNKNNWITVLLDGSAPDQTVKTLIDLSFLATAPKIPKKKKAVRRQE